MITMDGYITLSETARRLNVSASLVRALTTQGRLPCVRTPLGRVYPAEAVDRLAEERRRRAAPAGGDGA